MIIWKWTGHLHKRKDQIVMNSITDKLKEMIENEGPDVLINTPYEVFEELTDSDTADRKTAAALLHTFLMGTPTFVADGGEHSQEEVSRFIQDTCGFRKKISDQMAEVYLSLFTKENTAEWDSRRLSGMKSFMEQEWEIKWDGQAQWDGGHVYMDCTYQATIVISPVEGQINDDELDQMLRLNPFLSDEDIAGYFQNSLQEYLDSEFEDFCTADDYYSPTAEDFEAERYAEDWCKENGFELVSFDGYGSTGDFEPKHSRW